MKKKVRTKSVYTTGEISRISGVAPRTVTKWIDSGILAGFRIPGSTDRRVPHKNLIRFLTDRNMPMDGLQRDEYRVLLIGVDVLTSDAVHACLDAQAKILDSCNLFAAGMLAIDQRPQAIVVDAVIGSGELGALAARLRTHDETEDSRLALVLPEDFSGDIKEWKKLYSIVLVRPFDPVTLIEWIQEDFESCSY